MDVKRLPPILLVVPILILLGATTYGLLKLYQVRGFEQYPFVAVVNNNLGVKPKLQHIKLSIQGFAANQTSRNFKKISQSYEIYRSSILIDLNSVQTQEIHARFGDLEKLQKFIDGLNQLEQWMPKNESDAKRLRQLSKKLDRLYGNWNVYSRRFIQNLQEYHHELISELDKSLGILLFLLLVISLTSGVASYLMYRQYRIKKVMSEVLTRQTEDLLLAKDLAEQGTREKTKFLANMSHEIRTPLNGILGLSQLAHDKAKDADIKKYLANINRSGDVLLGLINNILDVSKIEAGKLTIENAEFSVWEVLDTLCLTQYRAAFDKGLSFKVIVSPSVPKYVYGDITRITQVLINLCSNAIKFTESGGVEVQVGSKTIEGKHVVYFHVKDTGVGVTQEAQKRIFTEFSQEDDSTTRQFGGTGLGLSICMSLIKAMGGQLSLVSEKNRGSDFYIEIPCEAATHFDIDKIIKPVHLLVLLDNHVKETDVISQLDTWNIHHSELLNTLSTVVLYIGDEVPSYSQLEFINQSKCVILVCQPESEELISKEISVPIYALSPPYSAYKVVDALEDIEKKIDVSTDQVVHKNIEDDSSVLNGERVLIVEDTMINQIVSQEFIEKLGGVVTIANNGQECIEILKNESFDLILMDIHMPVMDGVSATKLIRSDDKYKNLPIIALTANVMKDDVDNYFSIGMNACIPKPFTEDDFAETIKQVLR